MIPDSFEQLREASWPFALPLRESFRSITQREGVLIEGPRGWGEFAPFPEYSDATCVRWLDAALEAAWGEWPTGIRGSIPVNAIIADLPAPECGTQALAAHARTGATTYKIKVAGSGTTIERDLARVTAVVDSLRGAGIEPSIRVDANGQWSVSEAISAINALEQSDATFEYIEQPCKSLAELHAVRNEVGIAVAADESIRLSDDVVAAVDAAAVDVLVIKVAPIGGVAAALRAVRDTQLPVVVSGALDSSVGLSASLALAAALPSLPFACGLGTGMLLADDLVVDTLVPTQGILPVGRTVPDQRALHRAQHRLSPQRQQWWMERLERVWRLARERSISE